MALVTIPCLVAAYFAIRYLKKRKRDRARGKKVKSMLEEQPGLTYAALALATIPSQLAEQVMRSLPGPVAESVALASTELTSIDRRSTEAAITRLEFHMGVPPSDLSQVDPQLMATGMVKLILDDRP